MKITLLGFIAIRKYKLYDLYVVRVSQPTWQVRNVTKYLGLSLGVLQLNSEKDHIMSNTETIILESPKIIYKVSSV